MSIKTVHELMNMGMGLDDAVKERVRLLREATPQEQYWAYGADRAYVAGRREKVLKTFADAAADARCESDPYTYIQTLTQQVTEALKMLSCHEALIDQMRDNLLNEHGEMREFDPAIIDRAFRNDIEPMFPQAVFCGTAAAGV